WVPSNFTLDSISRASPVPVVRMPHAIGELPTTDQTRAAFDLPANRFVFLFIFDFHSYLERKNPIGLIQAFKKAFTKRDRAVLLLKSSRGDTAEGELSSLREAARGASVRILDRVLTRPELNTLMNLSDCYVSLHRSEGFGLTMAEAMSLGKPVIATAYSGNLEFMTPWNSELVPYELVAVPPRCDPYPVGAHWAEPDVDAAAAAMRRVAGDPSHAN